LAALTTSDYRVVSTLVPRIALGTVAILVAGTIATDNNNATTANLNKPIYLCVLVIAFAVTVIFLRNHRSTGFDSAVALLASCGLIWGIWTIERPQLLHDGVWEGFGDHVAVAALVLLLCIGSPLNLSFVGAFIKLFGSGLGSAPMQVPGPVLVVMPIVVCSAATGWVLMRAHRREGMPKNPVLDQATVTLTFTGTWSVFGLLYYVNRAYAEGQLQTMLLPCAVCIGALLSIAMHSEEVRALWQEKLALTRAQLSAKVKLIPVALLVCLCFSSALLTPDPVLAAKSLLNPPSASGFANYDLPTITQTVDAAQEYTADKPGELTYLGENFNYVSLVTHVQSNAVLFPVPPDRLVIAVIQIDCQYIETHHSRWIVLSSLGLAVFGPKACGLYHSVAFTGVPYGQLQELR
jgi:hypothetical protein